MDKLKEVKKDYEKALEEGVENTLLGNNLECYSLERYSWTLKE